MEPLIVDSCQTLRVYTHAEHKRSRRLTRACLGLHGGAEAPRTPARAGDSRLRRKELPAFAVAPNISELRLTTRSDLHFRSGARASDLASSALQSTAIRKPWLLRSDTNVDQGYS